MVKVVVLIGALVSLPSMAATRIYRFEYQEKSYLAVVVRPGMDEGFPSDPEMPSDIDDEMRGY